jgi:hypothetical protein
MANVIIENYQNRVGFGSFRNCNEMCYRMIETNYRYA